MWLIAMLVSVLGLPCVCEQPPLETDNSDKTIIVSEATPTGTVLGTVEATDPDNDYINIRFPVYETESRSLIIINQTTNEPGLASADLILKSELDREHAFAKVKLYLMLEDSSFNRFQVTIVIEMIVSDVNDEVPVFQNLPYRVDLSEDMEDLSWTYTKIKAIDPDTGLGGLVSYYMEPNTQSTIDAETFRETFSIDETSGDVTIHRYVDFEEISYYQFTIIAVDGGGLNSSDELIIRILDVQDTPPQIQGTPYVITIPENIAINKTGSKMGNFYSIGHIAEDHIHTDITCNIEEPQQKYRLGTGYHFFTIRALDGDRGVPNEVAFSFSSGTCISLFHIHEETGEITIASEIDRDEGVIMENAGVCEITVLVQELQTNFPQIGETTATTLFTVFVSDLNDNPPSFSQPVYFAYIEDTAQLNHPLKFENKTRISVKDVDQASNGVMEIMIRGQDGALTYDFEPVPNIIASNGVPLIKLKSPDILYGGSDSLTFTIIAVERDTPEKHTSSATLSISIVKVRTTTPTTTTVRTTPIPRYKDPFIPSLLGALFAVILLVWASVTTALYCYKRKLLNNNKVAPDDFPHPPPHKVVMSPVKSNGKPIPPPQKTVMSPVKSNGKPIPPPLKSVMSPTKSSGKPVLPPQKAVLSPVKSNGKPVSNGVHLPRVVDTSA